MPGTAIKPINSINTINKTISKEITTEKINEISKFSNPFYLRGSQQEVINCHDENGTYLGYLKVGKFQKIA